MYILKKMNAVLSLALALVFVDHLVLMSLLLLGAVPYTEGLKNSGFTMFYMMIAHVILGLLFIVKTNIRKPKGQLEYSSLNRGSIMQMVFGILGMVFTILHIFEQIVITNPMYVGHFGENPQLPVVVTMLFITLFWGVHIVLSVPKAAITIGFIHGKKGLHIWTAVAAVFVVLAAILIFVSSIRYFIIA